MGKKRSAENAEAGGDAERERSVTVSYGAFSCTLTGYKRPEEIVKALSEHFRMLAEQAPQFALPPPSPQVDVALLQQIAAQELRRQMDEGTIDLETVADLAGTPMRRVEPDAAPDLAEDAEIAAAEPGARTAPTEDAPTPVETPAERSARRRAATIASLRAAVAAATAAAQADRRETAHSAPPAGTGDEDTINPPQAGAPAPHTSVAEPAPLPESPVPAAPVPAAPAEATARPAQGSRLPVLRLVPELRLDASPPAVAAPHAQVASDLGFESYAARAGAERLAERIEAAAAYLTVIEGRSRFEAAAVVSLVARHPPPDEPSDALGRADAFAQLVKSGRLRRVEGNNYALAAPELVRATP